MGTKSRYWPRSQSGTLEYYDSATKERVARMSPVVFYDDFITSPTAIPAGGAAESGCRWVDKIVSSNATVAGVADTANGIVQCAMASNSEAEGAFLYMDDNRQFLLTAGLIIEMRVKISVLPTSGGEAVWGLAGDYSAAPDNITYSAWFTADGGGEVYCEIDDGTTDSSATSGVTATAAQTKIYKIDFTDMASVKYYIDGVRVATGTTYAYTATGANATLQPFMGCDKASGAGLGTIQIDYVKIWSNRS